MSMVAECQDLVSRSYTNRKTHMHTQSWILFFSPIININLSFHPDIWTSITKGLSEWPSKERGSVLFNKDKMFQWKESGLYFSFQFVHRQYWQDKLSESLSHEANPNCVNWVKINKWEDISKERNMKQRLFYLGKKHYDINLHSVLSSIVSHSV